MATNNFLTTDIIAKEAALRLNNNLIMANLVHKDYSKDFAKVGDTIQVKRPATFEAKDFTGNDATAQDIKEDNVLVKMNKVADVTIDVTSAELTQNIQDFGKTIVEPAVAAIAQKIDAELCGLYADVPYVSGTAGQTPSALANFANAGKVLNTNKAPLAGRNIVMDEEAQAKMIILDAIAGADKSGSTQALREANMGRIMGFNTYMTQNIKTHTKGTLAAGAGETIQTNAAVNEGATTIVFKSSAAEGDLTGTAKVGDVFSVEDAEGTFVITEVSALADGKQSCKFYPAAPGFAAGKDITFVGSHVSNLAFHKNAFALVSSALALPVDGSGYVIDYNGLKIRVTYGYTMQSKVNTISFDVLYGVKTLQPELAVRMLG